MLLFSTLSHTLFALLIAVPLASLADKSPGPSDKVYQGCKPKESWIKANMEGSKANDGIQMGECFSNTRVSPNAFAYFVTNHEKDEAEGAPYGMCRAFTVNPTAEDLESDLESTCGFWDRDLAIPET